MDVTPRMLDAGVYQILERYRDFCETTSYESKNVLVDAIFRAMWNASSEKTELEELRRYVDAHMEEEWVHRERRGG